MSSEIQAAVVPFLVGFTGHRQIDDPQALRQRLRQLLREITLGVNNCRPILMTGLAEGADQIAADVALELGWELVAALPFAATDHRHGAPGTPERQRFDQWLARARHQINISVLAQLETREPDPSAYAALGRWLGQFSHVLIAAWDGVANRDAGGTSDVLFERMKLEPPRSNAGDLHDSWSLSYVVPTPRRGQASIAVAGWYKSEQELVGATPATIQTGEALRPFARLNGVAERLGQVAGNSHLAQFPARFDAVEKKAKAKVTRRRWNWRWLCLSALTAVGAQGIYGDFGDRLPQSLSLSALCVFLMALAVSGLIIRRNQRLDLMHEGEPWDFRLFAEVLRVLRAWRQAGYASTRPELVSLLGARSHVPDWIVQAVRGFSLSCLCGEASESCRHNGGQRRDLEAMRKDWIEGQIRYFQAKVKRAKRAEGWRWLARRSLYASGLFATMRLVCDALGYGGLIPDVLWFLATVLPAAGGVMVLSFDLFAQAGLTPAAPGLLARFETLNALVRDEKNLAARSTVLRPDEPLSVQFGETGRLAVEEVCLFHKEAQSARSKLREFLF
ncbi:SLOG family protein [Thioclava kandeliae]|uniref:SMODS and SLOG-associating 2TM effector domain-containing protein n=1 Tax=Thioclava kandeliae TaxID=3070818 RepID=A0ABV1SIS8_9RHOB